VWNAIISVRYCAASMNNTMLGLLDPALSVFFFLLCFARVLGCHARRGKEVRLGLFFSFPFFLGGRVLARGGGAGYILGLLVVGWSFRHGHVRQDGTRVLVHDAAGRREVDVVVGCVPGFASWWLLCGSILCQYLVGWWIDSLSHEL